MAEQKFVSKANLDPWLEELAQSFNVYYPQDTGKSVVYGAFAKDKAPCLSKRPTESAKHIVFPRSEELFSYSYAADPEVAGTKSLALKEPQEPKAALVFGAPSCDARGFFAFDPVYNGSGTAGLAKDTYYLKRRAQTVFVVLACKTMLNTCFCHWSGGSPVSTAGADVLASAVADGYILQAVTGKGQKILESKLLTEASAEHLQTAEQDHATVLASIPALPEGLENSVPALLGLFDNLDFWKQQSAGCISCGACTYLCPACYCFNITDESNGIAGTRLRSWDNCMSPLFTLEASGHNPRTAKAIRLKNRVGHKFSYYPKLHEGKYSCSGCGRCIKSCPSSVDIRRIVQNAIAAVKENNNV